MRVLIASFLGVAGWICLPFAQDAPSAKPAQDAPGTKGPQIEQIVIPIVGRMPSDFTKPYWGSLGDPEVFREIRALSNDGIVSGPGQPAPKLRILREFFAPATDRGAAGGLVGHYVFIVECVRSDLKRVVAPSFK
jgi:hypothetical protein